MSNKLLILFLFCSTAFSFENAENIQPPQEPEFKYKVDQFADLQILRYQVKDFAALTPKQKELVYYLYEAGLSGRDMFYDQNFKHNLRIRKTLEAIVSSYTGDKNSEDFKRFMVYVKRVWFSNGIHHHYSTKKLIPEITQEYFKTLVTNSPGKFPLMEGETKEKFISVITPIIFDPAIGAKRVNLDGSVDVVKESANNYYEGVTQAEVEAFYKAKANPNDPTPVLSGLNSKVVKENGRLVEKIYKVGGMYSED
jgi:dipeptidyl-peptidase III